MKDATVSWQFETANNNSFQHRYCSLRLIGCRSAPRPRDLLQQQQNCTLWESYKLMSCFAKLNVAA